MNFKKILAAVIATSLLIVPLSSCGKKGGNKGGLDVTYKFEDSYSSIAVSNDKNIYAIKSNIVDIINEKGEITNSFTLNELEKSNEFEIDEDGNRIILSNENLTISLNNENNVIAKDSAGNIVSPNENGEFLDSSGNIIFSTDDIEYFKNYNSEDQYFISGSFIFGDSLVISSNGSIYFYSLDGKFKEKTKPEGSPIFETAILSSNKLFFLVYNELSQSDEPISNKLCYIEEGSYEVKSMDILSDSIYSYDSNHLSSQSYQSNQFSLIDTKTLKTKDISEKDMMEDYERYSANFYFDEASNKTFYSSYEGIYEYGKNGNSKKLLSLGSYPGNSTPIIIGSLCYILTYGNDEIVYGKGAEASLENSENSPTHASSIRIVDISNMAVKEKNIVILSTDSYIEQNSDFVYAKKKFIDAHPEYGITFEVSNYETYNEEIAAKVSSQDSDFDLFLANSENLFPLYNNGVILPFSDSEIINKNIKENVNENYIKANSVNGSFIGYNLYPNNSYVQYLNLDYLSKNNLPVPTQKWSFDEYNDFISKVVEIDENASYQISSPNDFESQIIGSGIDFENKKVNIDREALIKHYTKLKDEMSKYSGEDEMMGSGSMSKPVEYDPQNSIVIDSYFAKDSANKQLLYPPVLDPSNPVIYSLYSNFLVINKASSQLSLVEEFVSYLYDAECVNSMESFYNSPKAKDLLIYNEAFLKDKNNKEQYDTMGDSILPVNQDYIDLYNYSVGNLKVSMAPSYKDLANEYNKFFDGDLSPEAFVDTIIKSLTLRIEE